MITGRKPTEKILKDVIPEDLNSQKDRAFSIQRPHHWVASQELTSRMFVLEFLVHEKFMERFSDPVHVFVSFQ